MEYTQFLIMMNSVGGLTWKRYLWKVEPLVNIVLMSDGLHILWILLTWLWHRTDILWWVFGFCLLSSYPGCLELILCAYYSPVKAIVNISKRQLTTPEKSVLNKGLNFATTIKQIPYWDLIAPIEDAALKIHKA